MHFKIVILRFISMAWIVVLIWCSFDGLAIHIYLYIDILSIYLWVLKRIDEQNSDKFYRSFFEKEAIKTPLDMLLFNWLVSWVFKVFSFVLPFKNMFCHIIWRPYIFVCLTDGIVLQGNFWWIVLIGSGFSKTTQKRVDVFAKFCIRQPPSHNIYRIYEYGFLS